mgnify:CR=1 FL=1
MPKTKQAINFNKLQQRLRRNVGRAIADFGMIADGDRVMVCLSGGKDSYTMLDILLSLQAKAPVGFELIAVNLDQKQPDFPEHVLPAYLEELGIEYHVIERDTYSIVKRVVPEGKTLCAPARAFAAASSMISRHLTVLRKSRSGIIATTSSKRCF